MPGGSTEAGAALPQRLAALRATCELFLAAVERHAAAVPRAVQRLAAAVWRGALGRGVAQPAALALAAQLLIGCWLAPALAAPHAYGICIDSAREAFPRLRWRATSPPSPSS